MNANDLFSAVMHLDLEPIKMKLMHVESGEGWSLERANAVEKEYRRFLCMMQLYQDDDFAPVVDIDTFWHYHILDTMKYARDCEQTFGRFLHHYPYFGLRGGDDAQLRLDSGKRMRDLYESTFGEAYPPAALTAHAAAHEDRALGVAWSAGPGARMAGGKDGLALAWSAGPGKQAGAKDGLGLAWSAGPGKQAARAGDALSIAWSAGPGSRLAGSDGAPTARA